MIDIFNMWKTMEPLHKIDADSGDEIAERVESDGVGLPQRLQDQIESSAGG